MNSRENLLSVAEQSLATLGYTSCGPEELPAMAVRENFPLAVLDEPELAHGVVATERVVTYDVEVKMLMYRESPTDKSAPYLAIVEQDALALASMVAECEPVRSVEVMELDVCVGGLTHVGDVSMAMRLRVEMFRNE